MDKNFKFIKATKQVNSPDKINKFIMGQTYQLILDFIRNLQQSVKSKSNSQVELSKNPCVIGLTKLMEGLEEIYNDTPVSTKEQRFGNTAFKQFHEKLDKQYDKLISLVLVPNFNKDLALELKSYLLDCFGSNQRLDYGTGHELNFLCFLLILYCVGYYQESDFSSIVVHIFFKYILFVRKLQVNYLLEPAGAHGVWGLDEYQFLSFTFGAAQLINHQEILPSMAIDEKILEEYSDEYMYLSCIKHIKSVKHGGSFGEYAPMLYSITGVANWEKVAKGLIKMYEDEVLKKFVVIQHFYFGSVLTFN